MLLGNLGDTRSFSLVHNLEQYLEHKRFEYLELVALFQGEFFCVVLNILYHIDFPIVLIQKFIRLYWIVSKKAVQNSIHLSLFISFANWIYHQRRYDHHLHHPHFQHRHRVKDKTMVRIMRTMRALSLQQLRSGFYEHTYGETQAQWRVSWRL